jgi:iron complex outermembrane receptor protein
MLTGRRRRGGRAALAAALGAAALPAAAEERPPTAGLARQPGEVRVIGATPMDAEGGRDTLTADASTLGAADIRRAGTGGLSEALETAIGGVGLNHAQNNPFQPNLTYRGFEASPLAGNAQGLAVYVDGGRFNMPFGDTVNWDLIPDMAIDTASLQGSNPTFGLNALGGALAVWTKSGFTWEGSELELTGGTLGTVSGSVQHGARSGAFGVYLAGRGLHDRGWRDFSPSDLRQLFADVGWRGERAEVHVGLMAADNRLVGNGTAPVELLAVDRDAVFTHPDETRNRFGRLGLNARLALGDGWSLRATFYAGHLRQRTRNGDAADVEPCEDDEDVLCLEDGAPLTDVAGEPIANFVRDSPYARLAAFADEYDEGGPYAQLNRTATDTDLFGASAQATWQGRLGGMDNRLAIGVSWDGGRTDFTATSEVGALSLERGFLGPGIVVAQADGAITPVSVKSSSDYTGAFFHDSLSLTEGLTLSVGGRYNRAAVDLRDRIGTALNGRHRFERFNPQAGITYRLAPAVTAYAGYAEASRAPTPAELSCADPEAPCSLTNFFVGDPPLEQVRTRTVEAGARGRHRWPHAALEWKLAFFTTATRNDITFVASEIQGRAYFRNIGRTRRAGIEAEVTLATRSVRASLDYAWLRARYRDPLELASPENPFAGEDGLIRVAAGASLPGAPRHRLKAAVDWDASERLSVGLTARWTAGQYLFGDEANLAPRTRDYAVVGARASYRVGRGLELFLEAENLLDASYETFGTFSPTDEVPLVEAPDAEDPRSLSPGPPLTVQFGVRLRL